VSSGVFANRTEAGRALADRLQHLRDRPGLVVVGLPRGGVVVAAEVAQRLGAPLDALAVRKVGAPGQPELAIGAVASGDVVIVHHSDIGYLRLSPATVDLLVAQARAELTRREQLWRPVDRPPRDLTGRTVVLVDDGLATGATAEAAVGAVRQRGARQVIVAAPVAPPDTVARLAPLVDEVVVVHAPPYFGSVGAWYQDFDQTSDAEVRELLSASTP
jgi:putative phosphoribosyl transferase